MWKKTEMISTEVRNKTSLHKSIHSPHSFNIVLEFLARANKAIGRNKGDSNREGGSKFISISDNMTLYLRDTNIPSQNSYLITLLAIQQYMISIHKTL
jgi:hypothetical protein